MSLPAGRPVVIISGLLTLLVLGGGTLAVGLHNGWLRTAAADLPNGQSLTAGAQPTPAANDRAAAAGLTEPSPAAPPPATQDEVGVYRQKLEEAYRALDDAYAQIRALQSPQPQLASVRDDDDDGFTGHDGDEDRRGRQSHRRRSHDD